MYKSIPTQFTMTFSCPTDGEQIKLLESSPGAERARLGPPGAVRGALAGSSAPNLQTSRGAIRATAAVKQMSSNPRNDWPIPSCLFAFGLTVAGGALPLSFVQWDYY